MLQLYLKGLPAVVKAGTTFTLTRENPTFSDQGDYTFDVQLPLAGCPENQRIFGPLHHLQQPAAPTVTAATAANTYHLIAPPLDISGTYIITSITDEEVKVQLTAGRTALNVSAADDLLSEDIYVDELDLGRVYTAMYNKNGGTHYITDDPKTIVNGFVAQSAQNLTRFMRGSVKQSDGVLFPIYSEADSQWVNSRAHNLFFTETTPTGSSTVTYNCDLDEINLELTAKYTDHTARPHQRPETGSELTWTYPSTLTVAPQPYLCVVIERVMAALGFPLKGSGEEDCLRSDWRGQIFIANARATNYIARMLPHWTVKEFIQECENFLGITITCRAASELDEDERKLLGIKGYGVIRNRFTNSTTSDASSTDADTLITLSQSLDDHSSEFDSDSSTGSITTGNVAYDEELTDGDPFIRLSDDAWEDSDVKEYDTFDDLPALPSVPADTDSEATNRARLLQLSYIYYVKDTNRYYVIFESTEGKTVVGYSYNEIDQLGALIRRSYTRDADTTLRIIPCRQVIYNLPVRAYVYDSDSSQSTAPYICVDSENESVTGHTAKELQSYYALTTADTSEVTGYDPVAAQAVIKDSAEKANTNKRDIIEVAYFDPDRANHKGYISGTLNDNWSSGTLPKPSTPITDYLPSGTELIASDDDYPINIVFPLRGVSPISYPPSPRTLFSLRGDDISTTGEGTRRTIADYQTPTYQVDTRLQRTISFTDNITPDPTAIYQIRGRRYHCLKLELTISPDGLQPLKKGTFAEIN